MEAVASSPEPPGPFLKNALLNGVQSVDQIPSRPSSAGAQDSRETSVLTKAAHQLNIIATPSEEEDEDEDDDFDSVTEAIRMVPDQPQLPYSSLPTGVCYDSRMRFHTELDPSKDRSEYHPEDPRRIFWIFRTLCEAGLVYNKELTKGQLVKQPLKMLPARMATREEVLLVHEEQHWDFIKNTATKPDDWLTAIEKHFDSIYYNQSTFYAALLSAGSAIDTCLAVARSKEVKNAFAIIRPPGHHAVCDASMGFCHFDNVAIAANVVRLKEPSIRKILIVDWDVHHGNGIQQAFEDDPNVLYISIHVHQDGRFYPSGPYGDHLHCGIGPGIGKNINIPWPEKGMGDADYLFAFQHVVMPVAFDFNPDFVIIASGFDAAVGDQLGGCFVTPACYAHMTHMLKSLADGKVVACLEGGYNLQAIALSALAVTKTLMGEIPPKIPETAATHIGVETVRKVIAHQSKYWKCLEPKHTVDDFAGLPGVERMHDVIRAYQSNVLYDTHKMIPLSIYRDKISRSFEKQVLATPKYANEQPLLLIFHDPPELAGQPLTKSGRMELHQISMADILNYYISWAVKHGFNVIDVNIPKFLTGISDPEGDEIDENLKIKSAMEELAVYLWENYVEVNDAECVLFFGAGMAYHAISHILNTRTWEQLRQYHGTVGFSSDGELPKVSEMNISDLGKRFYKSSLIYTSRNHPFWRKEQKKLSKKHGKLQRSPLNTLNTMMWEHREEVQEFLLERSGLPSPTAKAEPQEQTKPKFEEDGDTIMVAANISS